MLKQQPEKVISMMERTAKKFYTLPEAAEALGKPYDKLYQFIRQHNKYNSSGQIEFFALPGYGKKKHITAADLEMLRAIFEHPEDYATKIKKEQK